MLKRTRRTFFYLSVLLFIILSYVVVLFALGYKYDFVQKKFFKTGSLEVKTNIAAQVYINDELAGDTSFLGDSYSKGRLLPRVFSLRLDSEGRQSWQKLVKVEAGFLSSFPKVVLVPDDFIEETVASSSLANITIKSFDRERGLALIGNKQKIEAISLKNGKVETLKQLPAAKPINEQEGVLSPDGNKLVLFTDHELWVKWVKDSSYQPYKKAGDSELITRFSQKILDIQWYKDSEHLIADIGGILKFIEIDNRGGLNIVDISVVSGPFYYDKDSDMAFKFVGKKLVKISLK